MHENREASSASVDQADRSAKAQVKQPNKEGTFGGGSGGKAAAQGERRVIQHPADTARGTGVPGIERRAPGGAGTVNLFPLGIAALEDKIV